MLDHGTRATTIRIEIVMMAKKKEGMMLLNTCRTRQSLCTGRQAERTDGAAAVAGAGRSENAALVGIDDADVQKKKECEMKKSMEEMNGGERCDAINAAFDTLKEFVRLEAGQGGASVVFGMFKFLMTPEVCKQMVRECPRGIPNMFENLPQSCLTSDFIEFAHKEAKKWLQKRTRDRERKRAKKQGQVCEGANPKGISS